MPIYSIISDEDIFSSGTSPEYTMKRIRGGYVQTLKIDGQMRVSRLITTNQRMYLDRRYQPTRFYD